MARKDVIKYYLQMQSQYFEMLSNVKELNQALKDNLIEESTLIEAQKDIEKVKENYERVSYIMMLLNKPNKKQKQFNEERENKEWYDYLKGSSKEALINENNDALKDFKKYVKQVKEKK